MSFSTSRSQDENQHPYSSPATAPRSHPQPPWNASASATPTPSFPPVLAPPYYSYLQTPTQSWDSPIPSPNPRQFSFQAYNPRSDSELPLADATTAVNNASSSARGRKRSTATTSGSHAHAKRRRILHEVDVAPSCGVGPAIPPHDIASSASTSQLPVTQRPLESYKGYTVLKNGPANAATDVWYFMRPLDSKDKPAQWPPLDAGGEPIQEVVLEQKPKSKYVGCKLCSKWHIWTVIPGGMTSTLRTHLEKHDLYHQLRDQLHLKHSARTPNTAHTPEPFTVEGFHERLIRFIAADDQSINVVECQEFRDLLTFVGSKNIENKDIPHRTKATQIIYEEFNKRNTAQKERLKNALGRISLTTDMWSNPNLAGFKAVTAHFIERDADGNLVEASCLIAFRFVDGSHTGEHLANIFFEILIENGILHKIGQITMDNASNCNTLMEYLEVLLREHNIPFHRDGNRIRCFPHIINIAAQTVLKELKENPRVPVLASSSDPTRRAHLERYANALATDPVGGARTLVGVCRKSGQRRSDLRATIEEGNSNGSFRDENGKPVAAVPVQQLLRDCETRWSSTFNMTGRVITLYPAITAFVRIPRHAELAHHVFAGLELAVLKDIHQLLEVPHAAQQLLSSSRTPSLSVALPAFEVLIECWKQTRVLIPELEHYANVGIAKIEEYVLKSRKSRIFALAMIINPIMKLDWIEKYWTAEEAINAENWIIESMLEYRRAARKNSKHTQQLQRAASMPIGDAARASRAQFRGFAHLQSLTTAVRRSTSTPSITSIIPAKPAVPQMTDSEIAERDAAELAQDHKEVVREWQRYKEDGLASEEYATDLIRFWDVKEDVYPHIFRVAADVLPVQASAVPCENVFSSGKQTCTPERNRLHAATMEVLQLLKYMYREDRLDFTRDLLAEEVDYQIEGEVSERAVRELMSAGKFEELKDLLDNSSPASTH